jgi:aldose 1-epimerase
VLNLNSNFNFQIQYNATTDADTVLNLTNHSYFNLRGVEQEQGVGEHLVTLLADHYVDNDQELIPTGTIRPRDCR